METAFQVKTSSFEGPLDLLLSLIEGRKLHISEVSLSKVAEDFINHTKEMSNTAHMSETAHFILVASTLILIKSKSLLPTLQLSEEEETSIEELERRLKLYKYFKKLSREIDEQFGREIIFSKNVSHNTEPVFSTSSDLSINNLKGSLESILNSLPVLEKLPETIVKKVISLEEAIEDLSARIQSAMKMSFNDFVKDKKDRVNVIVSFLGMLELVKDGALDVRQSGDFSDIEMENKKVGTPKFI